MEQAARDTAHERPYEPRAAFMVAPCPEPCCPIVPPRRHGRSWCMPMTVIEVCLPGRRPAHKPSELVGRDQDLAVIRAFVDELPAQGGTLLLSGEPGVGKSALLDAAEELGAIAGIRVLRAAGAEFEDSSFSGLNQLLLPLRTDVDRLDAPQCNDIFPRF